MEIQRKRKRKGTRTWNAVWEQRSLDIFNILPGEVKRRNPWRLIMTHFHHHGKKWRSHQTKYFPKNSPAFSITRRTYCHPRSYLDKSVMKMLVIIWSYINKDKSPVSSLLPWQCTCGMILIHNCNFCFNFWHPPLISTLALASMGTESPFPSPHSVLLVPLFCLMWKSLSSPMLYYVSSIRKCF
jgi:hypothetical protein